MKAHGLNVSTVKEPWAKVKTENEEDIWRATASHMANEEDIWRTTASHVAQEGADYMRYGDTSNCHIGRPNDFIITKDCRVD